MKAVILAGGKGTRLAPYTTIFPKPLVPIGHQPILEIIILQLIHHGIRDITLSVGYLGDLIRAYFEHARHRLPEFKLSYVTENAPRGTAGSLDLVDGLDETFLVMNGDVLSTIDYTELLAFHRANAAMLTIASYRRRVRTDFGVISIDPSNRVQDYIEKPEHEHLVSMGVYVYEPAVLKYIEPDAYLDFPDLVLKMLKAGEKLVGYPFDDYWLDIGRQDDYERAQNEFESIRAKLLPGEPENP